MSIKSSYQRSKFTNVKRDDIEKLINKGILDSNDIVYTSDSHENILIGDDLSINPVRSKIYRFLDANDAEKKLNEQTDTYSGQLVAILTDNKYEAYIVNKNNNDKFVVSKVSDDNKTIDYNTLGNKPIENLTGTLDNVIVVADLNQGIYAIKGQYKICSDDITTYLSANENIFIVSENDDSTISVKKITSSEITDYIISENQIKSQYSIATKEWVKEQGYITDVTLNDKIAALNYITKKEVEEYVSQVIINDIDPLIDEKITKRLNESFFTVKEADITNLFN